MKELREVVWFGDTLPDGSDRFDLASETSDRAGGVDQVLKIPTEIDSEIFLRSISEYGRKLVRKSEGINALLQEYHRDYEGTLQDFLAQALSVSSNFANTLAMAVVSANEWLDEEVDDEDEWVQELFF
jgi:hypothetical protein